MKRRSFLGFLATVPIAGALVKPKRDGMTVTLDEFAERAVEPDYKRSANRLMKPEEVAQRMLRILEKTNSLYGKSAEGTR